jgi:primosomal protein N' (replication factor Y)
MPELLADVAVRANIPNADAVFTYRVPTRLRMSVRHGHLVWAPLRRQRVQGIILNLYSSEAAEEMPPALRPDPDAPCDAEAPTIRDLYDIVDQEVALTPTQIRLARRLSGYYRTPLYEALALMLPPGVSQEAAATWRATADGLAVELGALPEGERAVLYYLRQRGELSERDLRQTLRGSDAELRDMYAALQERGLIVRGIVFSRPRTKPRIERLVRLTVAPDALDDAIASLARAPKQQSVLAFLAEQTGSSIVSDPLLVVEEGSQAIDNGQATSDKRQAYPLTALYQATDTNAQMIKALEQRGLIEIVAREVRRDPLAGDAVPPDVPPPLTPGQERVWREVAASLNQGSGIRDQGSAGGLAILTPDPRPPTSFLLHGVTGSGKTEIYLRAIGRVLRQGRQALVLVPEIALTEQLVRRFAARFPGKLAVLHSGLSEGERYDEWRRLRSGAAQLAIGSRSAVFAPLPNLGLIVVDEEHEPSYKHDGAPRYHARDTALRLAELTGSVIILGSATPSVESYAATQDNRLMLLSLSERVGMTYNARGLPTSRALPLPPVRLIDMRHELQDGNRSIFSRPLQQALGRAIDKGEQAILFLNRRGAASFIMCRDCGHVISCPNCSSPLTVHHEDGGRRTEDEGWRTDKTNSERWSVVGDQSSLLICHSCGHEEMAPEHCPNCWSKRIKSFGVGTQRVVEEIEKLLPHARALRWDRDSVTRKGDHARMLDTFLNHNADVLVGTQMIAKGLDLPLVSVVGVVTADTGLHLPDFRAGERTFQLMTQVAGRAGRRGDDAQVIIQTYSADHYALLAAQEHDYHTFYTQEIAFRRQTGYPPFSQLARFVYTSASDERCRRAAEALAQEIHILADALDLTNWSIIGPAPAFFHRQRNRYRWHLVLRAASVAPLVSALRLAPGWSLDIDPVNVL